MLVGVTLFCDMFQSHNIIKQSTSWAYLGNNIVYHNSNTFHCLWSTQLADFAELFIIGLWSSILIIFRRAGLSLICLFCIWVGVYLTSLLHSSDHLIFLSILCSRWLLEHIWLIQQSFFLCSGLFLSYLIINYPIKISSV